MVDKIVMANRCIPDGSVIIGEAIAALYSSSDIFF
jgi:hypothetical protein